MNRIIFLLCSGMVLFFASSGGAQDSTSSVGFGVTFGRQLAFFDEDFSTFSLPIDFGNFSVVIRNPNFRFEPVLGYFRTSSSSSSSFGKSESKSSNWRLGAVLAVSKPKASMNYYYGINVGILLSSESSEFNGDSDSKSKTDFFIGPTIGGEHMLNENFSLGGEIQINYISLGQFDGDSTVDVSQSIISTRATLILRWYL